MTQKPLRPDDKFYKNTTYTDNDFKNNILHLNKQLINLDDETKVVRKESLIKIIEEAITNIATETNPRALLDEFTSMASSGES